MQRLCHWQPGHQIKKCSEALENELQDMKKSCSGIMRVLNMSFQRMSLYFEWCSIALSTVIKDAHCPMVPSGKLTCKDEVISLWKLLIFLSQLVEMVSAMMEI